MKTLTHGMQVKMAQFRFSPEVTVGTVEGYAKEYNEDPNAAVERCLRNQKKDPMHQLAWTNKSAGVLTDNYPGKAEEMERKHQNYINAVELVEGEVVEIEGRKYTVKYLGDYSDPVRFVPVKGGV